MAAVGPWAEFEREAYRSLNAWLEPLIRAGLGAPLLTPLGAIVLEVKGRKSGRIHSVPLLAWTVPGAAVVSTFRGPQSHWVRNLQANPECSWVVAGTTHAGAATVFTAGSWPEAPGLPATLAGCVAGWRPWVESGWAVAVLQDDPA
ncbi:MAG: nitroreductase/quinone reductase family protein [Dehalococcoidia bacterium]